MPVTPQAFLNEILNEDVLIAKLHELIKFSDIDQQEIINTARNFINIIREDKEFGIEEFMQEYSLSTIEGVAIMCMAEGLLRIPDKSVTLEFAYDKLGHKNWQNHILKLKSLKGKFATLGLYISGMFADASDVKNIIARLVTKVGEPVFLKLLKQAIKFLSKEFIFGFTVRDAIKNTRNFSKFRFAFDLLGESARTSEQAAYYYTQYLEAIDLLKEHSTQNSKNILERPNLSVKLTALYPRLELSKIDDIDKILLPKLVSLIEKVAKANLTITFDAEECNRQDIYLHILTKLVTHPNLQNFTGVGFVVQAYQLRAYEIIDHIIDLSKRIAKKIPVRLVKGAYWDYEIKHAQELGLAFYPVFTKKEYTDCSYVACAKKMLENDSYIFSQFATHNALTAATIIEIAKDKEFEFQKLHGMGRVLHNELLKNHKVRIYAPIGKLEELLAYLMRRMLENGANASFVSQVNNETVPSDKLAYSQYEHLKTVQQMQKQFLLPKNIYPDRENAMGYDLGYKNNFDYINENVSKFYSRIHKVGSIINGKEILNSKASTEHFCPAKYAEKFADITAVSEKEIKEAITSAAQEFETWSRLEVGERVQIIRKVADLFEENKFELYSLIIKEAGKTIKDAIGEVIEAVDFCRYYANQAEMIMTPRNMPSPTGESNVLKMFGRGVFLCISPWNFPLAIFTGQVIAALSCGNTVLAKPADQTPVIANYAVKLMHKAGIPIRALQLVISAGRNIGEYAVKDERIAGVVFTGSTGTAKIINASLAQRQNAIVPFIAETGGQNAMIVDSSSLLEQVTDDVIASSFQSAGQRCSALRMLYVQEEIYEPLLNMIKNAMELQKVGDNSDFATDIGPVINKDSFNILNAHIEDMSNKGFKATSHPQKDSLSNGFYFYPHIIEVNSINDIPDEKFGPVLHIARYKASELDKVIDEINDCGFGLTFGIHSRIEKKIEYISSRIKAGNIYVNRSIIGAKVESQPFGGENKSGTGFKAGGPHYLLRFMLERVITINLTAIGGNVELLNQK